MNESVIEVDYLIVGAGAAGMAFADSLVTESKSTIAIVDRRPRPGGPLDSRLSLRSIASAVGVLRGRFARALGSGAKDEIGFNKGFYELAAGSEVTSSFDLVMRQQFLPSGRVQYFPMSEVGGSARHRHIAHFGQTIRGQGPHDSRCHVHPYVDPLDARAAICQWPPASRACRQNDLARVTKAHTGYVVMRWGKTGMDTVIWLLGNGVDPDKIRWIMPRDYWWMNRATYQPGDEFFARLVESLANGVEALAGGVSVDDVLARLEAFDEIRRIDRSVKPAGFHGGFVSDSEMEQLRRVRNVVRLGRVTRIEADQIVLERGAVPTSREFLHVDCSATGIPALPAKPIFDGDRITLQWVRMLQPTFSWSLIGHVEATYQDETEKNRICAPIAPPDQPKDWVRMMATGLSNQLVWSKSADIREWQFRSRLDPFTRRIRSIRPGQTEAVAHLERYSKHVGPAAQNAAHLLETLS